MGIAGEAYRGAGGGGQRTAAGANGGCGVVVIKEKGGATKVSGMWSMEEQYDEALEGNWSFESSFGPVNVLVIGGGGGGMSSGAGAGGYQWNSSLPLSLNTTFTATIGAGGTGAIFGSPETQATIGGTTSFSGPTTQTIESTGGAQGIANSSPGCTGKDGASGSGGHMGPSPGPVAAGSGNSPAKFMSQGNPGGDGTPADNAGFGGGGGAGAAAANLPDQGPGVTGPGGAGGAGSSAWPGDSTLRAGGGGGRGGYPDPVARCSPSFPTYGGAGGPGGGGNGVSGHDPSPQPVPLSKTLGFPGTANTGGGGGGGGGNPNPCLCSRKGGSGGSGVVLIQYPGAQQAVGGTVTSIPGCKTQHAFNSTSTFHTAYPGNPTTIDYVVVGGGASGGVGRGGGGGAGGYRTSYGVPGTPGLTLFGCSTYPITIGAGGAAQSFPSSTPTNMGKRGSDSIFFFYNINCRRSWRRW